MPGGCSLSALTEINVDDLLTAWGFGQAPWGLGQAPWGLRDVRVVRRLLRALARPPSVEFARQMCAFDEAVGVGGLRAGGAMLCRRYTGGVRAAGLEHVPVKGPALILSNHPGLCDTVALFAAISRRDLRVIAYDRPFLRALPNTVGFLDLLPEDASARGDSLRAGVTRAVARHLRRGGAALTFPAGRIEPDPLTLPGAAASLDGWSESVGLFARLVPQMQIVVAMVGGVYTPAALRNPLTHLRRRRQDRELLAAALQLAWRPYQRNVIDVAFAPPLYAADLLAQDKDPVRITRAIADRARELLANWPTQSSVVVSSGELER